MQGILSFAAAWMILITPAAAQSMLTANTLKLDDPSVRPTATVEDFAWMAGRWQGEFLDGVAEEVWTPPSGGSMLGMFKLVGAEGVSIYEIMTLVEEEGSVVLKLKHFNADLTGWEEKDDHVAFPLVKAGEREAYFEGLTFRRTADDELQGFLVMTTAAGLNEIAFTYTRVD